MQRAWLLLLSAALFGQELQVSEGRMTMNSILRPRPDSTSPAVYQFAKDAPVRVIAEKGEFVRVAGAKGPLGWVPKTAVEVTGQPKAQACPAVAGPAKKSSNPPVIVDSNDLLKLELRAEQLVGMGHEITTRERESLINEGVQVRVGGNLAAKPEGPRMTPACSGGAADEWLLNITDGANLKEFEGVVARVGPVKRNPKWTLAKLRAAAEKQYPVLVTGVLYYDAAGFLNNDSGNPLPGTLRRSTLWELRSVTSILVCTGGACEPGSPKGWLPLEAVSQ